MRGAVIHKVSLSAACRAAGHGLPSRAVGNAVGQGEPARHDGSGCSLPCRCDTGCWGPKKLSRVRYDQTDSHPAPGRAGSKAVRSQGPWYRHSRSNRLSGSCSAAPGPSVNRMTRSISGGSVDTVCAGAACRQSREQRGKRSPAHVGGGEVVLAWHACRRRPALTVWLPNKVAQTPCVCLGCECAGLVGGAQAQDGAMPLLL